MQHLDILLPVILCIQANSYDYSEYDFLSEPSPPTAKDLPPGYLDDIDGEDVNVLTPTGPIMGRRRVEEISMSKFIFCIATFPHTIKFWMLSTQVWILV